jgi:uncharacterized membrane protein YgdD (TMEM256/DUF423 family)
MTMTKSFFIAGTLAAGLAVALGAFGAHGLQSRVTPERIGTFETGVRYHMYHALALFVVAWVQAQWPSWQAEWAGYLFIGGILIFSGSLYLLVLTDTPWLGAITPLGGVAFLAGWALLCWAGATSGLAGQ